MTGVLRLLALALAAASLAASATAAERPNIGPPQGEPLSQARLNWLVERDRPRDLVDGGPFDKNHKRYENEVDRQAARARKAATDYRRSRSVKDWRTLLDSVYRGGGLRDRDLIGGGSLNLAFSTLHEVGPPQDDPDNAGNAQFTARRHRAMMRLLARYLWQWHWTTGQPKRIAASYLQDCERRPSPDRPTGNNHDPSCGFIFEMDYKAQRVGDKFWEERNIPQSFANFAAGVPSNNPEPMVLGFTDYPLVLNRPQSNPYELWAGNERGLIQRYQQPYAATREFQERKHIEHLAWQRSENDRLSRLAEQERQAGMERLAKLGPRWDALWAMPSLTQAQQLELEDISWSIGRADIYRSRYQIVSYDRLDDFCRLGFPNECARKEAIEARGRAARAGPSFGSPPNASVTVRTYDRNGNYTGSTTTTRIDAELMGARPN